MHIFSIFFMKDEKVKLFFELHKQLGYTVHLKKLLQICQETLHLQYIRTSVSGHIL